MKSLLEYILESKEPTAKELGHRCKEVAYNMLKQISLGGYSNKECCSGLQEIDDQDILNVIYVYLNSIGWQGSIEKTVMMPIDKVAKALREKNHKNVVNGELDVDNEYEWIVDMLGKNRLEIFKTGLSTGNDKYDIVAEFHSHILRFLWTEDKEMLEDIWPEDFKK